MAALYSNLPESVTPSAQRLSAVPDPVTGEGRNPLPQPAYGDLRRLCSLPGATATNLTCWGRSVPHESVKACMRSRSGATPGFGLGRCGRNQPELDSEQLRELPSSPGLGGEVDDPLAVVVEALKSSIVV